MNTVTITRSLDTGKESIGVFNAPNFNVRTLERPWKNNKTGISCIPKGTYTVKWTLSPKLARYTYQVMDVPGRSGIRFHPGNYFFDVEGCILLGTGFTNLNDDGELDIINSKVTISAFENYMQKKPFTLVIK